VVKQRSGARTDGSAASGRRGRRDRAPTGDERERDADRSRRQLLAAALDEFSANGFAGTRVADIAARAGVNKQLINYYFDSKEGLYRELQRTWLQREATFSDPDLPLDELAARYLLDALRDPRLARLLLWRGLSDSSEAPPDVTGDSADLTSMRNRRSRGELADDLDPAAVLLAVIGMVTAPVALPDMARKIFGLDPSSPEFATRYGEQLRRMVRHLAGRGPADRDSRDRDSPDRDSPDRDSPDRDSPDRDKGAT
jgi:TetR/AcrR family transcriptional regulator